MAVTEIGHVIEYFHRCQNVPFIFSLLNWDILASATCTRPNRCRNAKISQKKLDFFGIFTSIRSHTSRRYQNVPIQKGKYKWDILASMKLFNHVTYLCHSQFGTFWQPWRKTFVDTFNLFQNLRNHDDKTLFEPFHFSESFL